MKLKYIIKEVYSYTNETVQSSSILVVQIIVKRNGVYIGGSTNGIQIKHIRDNQSIATSKVELYDGNNSATGATKFYLGIDFDI